MSAPGFWDNPATAQEGGRKRARIEKRIASGESIHDKSEELDLLLELQKEGEPVDQDLRQVLDRLDTEAHSIEMTMKLSGEHDDRDVIMQQLTRMKYFLRWQQFLFSSESSDQRSGVPLRGRLT